MISKSAQGGYQRVQEDDEQDRLEKRQCDVAELCLSARPVNLRRFVEFARMARSPARKHMAKKGKPRQLFTTMTASRAQKGSASHGMGIMPTALSAVLITQIDSCITTTTSEN